MKLPRNVSDDGYVFTETKLLMYFSRGNHGYFPKTDMFYAKLLFFAETEFLLFSFVNGVWKCVYLCFWRACQLLQSKFFDLGTP